MPEIELNGPAIPKGTHNIVLREVSLHSPVAHGTSPTDFNEIEIGVRESDAKRSYTTWIGSWDQRLRPLEAGTPIGMLDLGEANRRLKEEQALVVRIDTTGTPASLRGARVDFRLSHVGSRAGPVRPLVAAGATVTDANTRTALRAVEHQVNERLASWTESVNLEDPPYLAPNTSFQGRLQVDSTTQISLQRYTGNWVEVDGQPLSITGDGLTRTSTQTLLESTGEVAANVPQADTLYNVYVGRYFDDTQIRLSTTAPTRLRGTYYLGVTELARTWRFVGWVYMDGSTYFQDSETQRFCCNYYNRLVKDLYVCPAYSDDDTTDTFEENNLTWTQANAGVNSRVEFISNAEDAMMIGGTTSCYNSGAFVTGIGLAISGATNVKRAGFTDGTSIDNIHIAFSDVLSVGYQTVDLVTVVTGGTGTYYSNYVRLGGTEDPAVTYLQGEVLV